MKRSQQKYSNGLLADDSDTFTRVPRMMHTVEVNGLVVATVCSRTLASRIANALNKFKPRKRYTKCRPHGFVACTLCDLKSKTGDSQ